jgi:excisionase family DNA binding protein
MIRHPPNRGAEVPFYTVGQIAERWQCSEKKVRRLIARGELIAHRFGSQLRISEADLKTFERVHRGD